MIRACFSIFVTINSSCQFIIVHSARYTTVNIPLVRFEFVFFIFSLFFSPTAYICIRRPCFPTMKRSDGCTFPFNDFVLAVFCVTRVKLSLPLHQMHLFVSLKSVSRIFARKFTRLMRLV